ncbi:MAG: transposase [Candidatus Thiodiazotropha endolucinida]
MIIVSDQETGTLLHQGDDSKIEGPKEWCNRLSEEQRIAIESVSTDMWPAFAHATLESLPGAEEKTTFDKFHIAKGFYANCELSSGTPTKI